MASRTAWSRSRSISGSDFEVVTVSFNPQETWQLAAAKKANYVEKYPAERRPARLALPHRPGRRISRNSPMPPASTTNTTRLPSSTRMPAASWCITPEGKISRYFYGIEYKSQRPSPGPGGGVQEQDRKLRRPGAAVLLPLRSHDRQIRTRDRERDASGRFGQRACARNFIFVMLRRERHGNLTGGRPNPCRSLFSPKQLPPSPARWTICIST